MYFGERITGRFPIYITFAGNRKYYFLQLDGESNRYANLLQAFGLQPAQVVATFLPKVPDQFFAFLASLNFKQWSALCFQLW